MDSGSKFVMIGTKECNPGRDEEIAELDLYATAGDPRPPIIGEINFFFQAVGDGESDCNGPLHEPATRSN